jgi:hypothetical protein
VAAFLRNLFLLSLTAHVLRYTISTKENKIYRKAQKAICDVHFLATARVIKPSGSDEKDGGGWWADLPDWLMRREKPHIALSLGRCGARYYIPIILKPQST